LNRFRSLTELVAAAVAETNCHDDRIVYLVHAITVAITQV